MICTIIISVRFLWQHVASSLDRPASIEQVASSGSGLYVKEGLYAAECLDFGVAIVVEALGRGACASLRRREVGGVGGRGWGLILRGRSPKVGNLAL